MPGTHGRVTGRWAAVTIRPLISSLLWVVACTHHPPSHTAAEYLGGIQDALSATQPRILPTLIITWEADEPDLGQCKRVSGEVVIYLHMGRILQAARSESEVRPLVAEVLSHELAHANMTCTDADHYRMPRPSVVGLEKPDGLKRRFAWETVRPDR
ncbi:MAG TPA: hypothetical protein VFQ61_10815 [Polyangiaceae bacterium]|nr:hypothetical protein [Polyangiaceae bacterium]